MKADATMDTGSVLFGIGIGLLLALLIMIMKSEEVCENRNGITACKYVYTKELTHLEIKEGM